ncbi:MAG: hypothetical protein U5R06_06745 [candidate division KSB1 bacterium]|nr:hypothetical protein [candidate division KSB1 bacterium]
MKQLIFLILIFMIPHGFATSPGTSNVSARITDFGEEFGYGIMFSPTQMFLVNVNGHFSHSTSSIEYPSTQQDGPDTTHYAIHVFPELRFYNRPKSKISPFFGVFTHFGYGGGVRELPDNQDAGLAQSQLTIGAGFSTGAEVFLSRYLSLAVSARWLHYTFENASQIHDTGSMEITTKHISHNLDLKFNPAVYLRLHF